MIYKNLMECNFVGDTKAPLLRYFSFLSGLKYGDISNTGQNMDYQILKNLHFKPLLKNSFHSFHIDLIDTRGEKITFLSVGFTRLVFMFRKTFSTQFQRKTFYKMVPARQIEIPYYRDIGRQRGRGFGALAQNIGRKNMPFLHKNVVPAAKRVGADLMEFAARKTAEIVNGRKFSETQQRVWHSKL